MSKKTSRVGVVRQKARSQLIAHSSLPDQQLYKETIYGKDYRN